MGFLGGREGVYDAQLNGCSCCADFLFFFLLFSLVFLRYIPFEYRFIDLFHVV